VVQVVEHVVESLGDVVHSELLGTVPISIETNGRPRVHNGVRPLDDPGDATRVLEHRWGKGIQEGLRTALEQEEEAPTM
jgi:hypothetical protein